MKKSRWLLLTVMAMVVGLNAVYAENLYLYAEDTPNLDILLENIIPSLINAGDEVLLVVRVVNNGDSKGLVEGMDLVLPKNVHFVSSNPSLDEKFELCGGCSKVYNVYLKVDKNAASAKYPVRFILQEPSISLEKEFLLNVKAKPIIVVNSPEYEAYPNSKLHVDLLVYNKGKGIANDVLLKLNSNIFSIIGGNVIYVGKVEADGVSKVSFDVLVPESLEPGSYSLDFDIFYEDDTHNKYEDHVKIGLNVISNVSLEISSLSLNPSAVYMNEETTLILRVENIGEGKAEDVRVSLKGDIGLLYDKNYIGSLDEDEDASVVFTFIPAQPGEFPLEINVFYKDDTGYKSITDTYTLKILKRKRDYAKYVVLVVSLTAIIAYYVFKKRKSKR